MGDTVIAENRPEGSFIWENTYFEDKRINQYDLTIFSRIPDDELDIEDQGKCVTVQNIAKYLGSCIEI